MTSRDFCYWLQGFFEVTQPNGGKMALDMEKVECIRNHLNMVFKHEIDPSHGDAAHQAELAKAHVGKSSRPPKKGHSGGDSEYTKPRKALC